MALVAFMKIYRLGWNGHAGSRRRGQRSSGRYDEFFRCRPRRAWARVSAGTTGSAERSAARIAAKPSSESTAPAISGTRPDRSRIVPSSNRMPGFFALPGYGRRSFIPFPSDIDQPPSITWATPVV